MLGRLTHFASFAFHFTARTPFPAFVLADLLGMGLGLLLADKFSARRLLA